MMLLLLASLSFAQDEPIFLESGKSVVAVEDSWVVPDWMWREGVANTLKLQECEPALTACTATATIALNTCQTSLTGCQEQIALDQDELGSLRAQLTLEEMRRKNMRQQRNTAIGVAAAFLAGGTVAAVVALR